MTLFKRINGLVLKHTNINMKSTELMFSLRFVLLLDNLNYDADILLHLKPI